MKPEESQPSAGPDAHSTGTGTGYRKRPKPDGSTPVLPRIKTKAIERLLNAAVQSAVQRIAIGKSRKRPTQRRKKDPEIKPLMFRAALDLLLEHKIKVLFFAIVAFLVRFFEILSSVTATALIGGAAGFALAYVFTSKRGGQ